MLVICIHVRHNITNALFHDVTSQQPFCFLSLLQLAMLFDGSCQLLYVPPPLFFRGLLYQKEWGILKLSKRIFGDGQVFFFFFFYISHIILVVSAAAELYIGRSGRITAHKAFRFGFTSLFAETGLSCQHAEIAERKRKLHCFCLLIFFINATMNFNINSIFNNFNITAHNLSIQVH